MAPNREFQVNADDEHVPGERGVVVNQTLTGHEVDPENGNAPVPGTGSSLYLLRFADGLERWYHEADLVEVTG